MLSLVVPMPAHAWARASANGPILDFTNPANAKKIYDFLNRHPARPARTRPTRCGRSWTGRTSSRSSTTPPARTRWCPTRATAARPRRSPDPAGRPLHLRHRRVQRAAVEEHRYRLHAADRHPAAGRREEGRVPRVRLPRLRLLLRGLQLRGQDRRLQQHHQPALRPPGARAPPGRAGLHQGFLPRRGRRGLRADPGRACVPVRPGERAEEPVPVQRERREQPAEVARLEGRARRHRPRAPRQAPARASAVPGSRPGRSSHSTCSTRTRPPSTARC